jgi:patatin-like phospholipase/acyl hydrolase
LSALVDPPNHRFRILSIDGGGVRGLIPALVLKTIEERLQSQPGHSETRIVDRFDLVAGTSSGGLTSIALTAPKTPLSPDELVQFYTEASPKIFHRSFWRWLYTIGGLFGPKYSSTPLREALTGKVHDGMLSEATRDLLITSFDMNACEPHFFKRWKALASTDRDLPLVDVALSTSAAPTYFGSHGVGEMALVDGGVFANNPVIAAIAEALGRNSDPPALLRPEDLFVVSIGTGDFKTHFKQSEVGGWGTLAWVTAGEEVPVLSAMMEGSADAADYWAHMLLNHSPGDERPSATTLGRGKRFYRLQAELDAEIGLDDASRKTLEQTLPDAAHELIRERDAEIDEIVAALSEPAAP